MEVTIISKTPKRFSFEDGVFKVIDNWDILSPLEKSSLNSFNGILVEYSDSSTCIAVEISTSIENGFGRITTIVREFYSNGVVKDIEIKKSFKDGAMVADNTTFVNLATGEIVSKEVATNEDETLKPGYVTQIMYFRLSPPAGEISGYIQNGLLARY